MSGEVFFLCNYIAQFSSISFIDDIIMLYCQKREMPRTLGYSIEVLDFSPNITECVRSISERKNTLKKSVLAHMVW